METSLNKLKQSLTRKASIQPSESVSAEDFEELFTQAVLLHNSSYTVSPALCTVPEQESLPIVLLAWADLCFIRAAKFASQPNVSGAAGFGTDRNTPYYKQMDLRKSLLDTYTRTCQSLGLAVYARVDGALKDSGPVCVDLATTEDSERIMTPLSDSSPLPTPYPSAPAAVSAGKVTLNFTMGDFPLHKFSSFVIAYLSGTEDILDPARVTGSTGLPGVNSAAQLFTITVSNQRSVVFTGLSNTTGLRHQFLVAALSTSGKASISHVVSFTQP